MLEIFDILVRGAGLGACTCLAFVMGVPRWFGLKSPNLPAKQFWPLIAVCLVYTAYILFSSPPIFAELRDMWGFSVSRPPYFPLTIMLCTWGVFLFIFDSQAQGRTLYAPLALTFFGLHLLVWLLPVTQVSKALLHLFVAALTLLILLTQTYLALRLDLMPVRRIARLLLLVYAAFLCVSTLFTVFNPAIAPRIVIPGLQAFGFIGLGVVGTILRVRMDGQIYAATKGEAAEVLDVSNTNIDPSLRALLGKIETLMAQDLWREEGLTIAKLAKAAAAPEYLVRKAIHKGLGYRNFSTYLNSFRIAAAKQDLRDPRHAHTAIAQLGFDLGFGSAATFTRVFRDHVGQSPSAFRQDVLSRATST